MPKKIRKFFRFDPLGKKDSGILGSGHGRQPARPRLEIGSAPELMRRRPNQSSERSLHQVAFHSANPHQRIRHRRSPEIQAPARIVRRGVMLGVGSRVLVQ